MIQLVDAWRSTKAPDAAAAQAARAMGKDECEEVRRIFFISINKTAFGVDHRF